MTSLVRLVVGVSCLRWKTLIIIILVFCLHEMMTSYDYDQNPLHRRYQRNQENIGERIGEGRPDQNNITTLLYRMKGPLPADDPQLLQLVRERYILPPSTKPYALKLYQGGEKHGTLKYNTYRTNTYTWPFLNEVIMTLFKDEPPGFFVEAGALDGEFLSNTLDLETKLNWKGLLVEADSEVFNSLKKKNRRAWASHTCLAIFPYPHQTTLVKFTNNLRPDGDFAIYIRGFNALIDSSDIQQRMAHGFPIYEVVQCLPLQTLLLALNVTHVQFISLDVEGVEINILESFWGSKVLVDVWAIEHRHPNVAVGKYDPVNHDFISWFESKGYTLYTYGSHSPRDYFFIRNGSEIYDKAFSSRPSKYKVQ